MCWVLTAWVNCMLLLFVTIMNLHLWCTQLGSWVRAILCPKHLSCTQLGSWVRARPPKVLVVHTVGLLGQNQILPKVLAVHTVGSWARANLCQKYFVRSEPKTGQSQTIRSEPKLLCQVRVKNALLGQCQTLCQVRAKNTFCQVKAKCTV